MPKKPKATLSQELTQELVAAALRVAKACHAYGPVDDGRPEGDEFDESLTNLSALASIAKKSLDGKFPEGTQ